MILVDSKPFGVGQERFKHYEHKNQKNRNKGFHKNDE